jgi:dihydrofolate reductase
MANYVFIATSLDGYIADADGGIEWLNDIPNPDNSDFGYAEFISGIDAIVMGRKSYEKVLTFGSWPYELPVFVLSSKLDSVPGELSGKIEIIHGDVKELVGQLTSRGYRNLYVDGGMVIQSFLNAGLIDEMIITRVPILLGDGIPLFGKISNPIKFNHVKTVILNNYLVQSNYTRITE